VECHHAHKKTPATTFVVITGAKVGCENRLSNLAWGEWGEVSERWGEVLKKVGRKMEKVGRKMAYLVKKVGRKMGKVGRKHLSLQKR